MGDVEAATEKPEVTADFIAGLYRQYRVEPAFLTYLDPTPEGFCGCPKGVLAGHIFGFATASKRSFLAFHEDELAAALGISRDRLDGIEAGFCWPVSTDDICHDNVSEYQAGHAIGLATYKILKDLP